MGVATDVVEDMDQGVLTVAQEVRVAPAVQVRVLAPVVQARVQADQVKSLGQDDQLIKDKVIHSYKQTS